MGDLKIESAEERSLYHFIYFIEWQKLPRYTPVGQVVEPHSLSLPILHHRIERKDTRQSFLIELFVEYPAS